MTSKFESLKTTRREFMVGVGGLVVAVSVPSFLKTGQANRVAPTSLTAQVVNPDAAVVDNWLKVGTDGTVTIYTGKVELGTGTLTATRQVVAEELSVPYSSTKIVQGVTGTTVDQGTTAGSQTMRTQWASGLRISAAAAYQVLLQMAATKFGVPTSSLTASGGTISVTGSSSQSVSYGSLVAGSPIAGTISTKPPYAVTLGNGKSLSVKTKDSKSYKVVGQPIAREDVPGKVTSDFSYVQDIKLAGMLYGRVVRPGRGTSSESAFAKMIKGTLANGTVHSIDKSSVSQLPGNVRVVQVKNFVGVVADREEQAIAAAQALKVTWSDPASLPAQSDLYNTIKSSKPDNTRYLASSGDVNGAISESPKQVTATYTFPYQAHASIGPSAAVAWVHDGGAQVWSGTQAVYPLRTTIATLLGLDESKVQVTYVEGSGCYGLNGADDVSLAAALLSNAVKAPVRLQYMRADEISWENFGTPMVIEARAGLDATGHITGWDYQNWSYSRGNRPGGTPGNLPTGVLAGFPEQSPPKSPPASPPLGDDGSNAFPWYTFPTQLVRSHGLTKPWLFTGPLRSPARIQNTFAQESFMDELAQAAAQDPIDFRLAHTTDSRLKAVIQKAQSAYGWKSRTGPNSGQSGNVKTGRGIAAVRYEGSSAWVAAIVEVTVDTTSGAVTPTAVVIAHDCGVVINPDGLTAQIEGNVVQGLSRSLKEEVQFDASGVLSVDWGSYPIATFPEIPDNLKIELINRPDKPALGAGESTISVMPGAIANAIWDATGVRMRQVPFTPARILAALKAPA